MVVVSVSTRAKTSTTTEGISGWRRVASPRAVATASRLKTPFRPFWRSSYSALLTTSGLDSFTTAQSQVLSKNKFVYLSYVSFKIESYMIPQEPKYIEFIYHYGFFGNSKIFVNTNERGEGSKFPSVLRFEPRLFNTQSFPMRGHIDLHFALRTRQIKLPSGRTCVLCTY